MTGLLHQLGARARVWTGTWRIRQDERTRIIKPDTLWRWKRLIPWKTAGRAPLPSALFFHMKRSQFYISHLPSISLYPARLVLAVAILETLKSTRNEIYLLGGWVEGFPAPVVELYFQHIQLVAYFGQQLTWDQGARYCRRPEIAAFSVLSLRSYQSYHFGLIKL